MELKLMEYKTGKAFCDLASDLLKMINQVEAPCIENDKCISMIVNLTFACELYMKSLAINYKKEHYLDELFGLIPKEVKATIQETTICSMKRWKPQYDSTDFTEDLKLHRRAYTDWRYYFQSSKDLNYSCNFMACLTWALEGVIKIYLDAMTKKMDAIPESPES